ncbi:hypothetical protein LB524_26425 [Mesorhizobium sp. ESP6-5]|uniref:hypothetical protein n=1 Tax=Mesorhizobium sp. ESP6-5 TaxID=2876623 RepID=UPI001CCEB12B|nr:hypothetical protein [Mesorhizobium sp. ESP6-5]MBZ9758831.1 hypothetical protein [Mesorhizobium sp. ESP6-5]
MLPTELLSQPKVPDGGEIRMSRTWFAKGAIKTAAHGTNAPTALYVFIPNAAPPERRVGIRGYVGLFGEFAMDEPKTAFIDRLIKETSISEKDARELIALLGLNWSSLVREAKLLKPQAHGASYMSMDGGGVSDFQTNSNQVSEQGGHSSPLVAKADT